MFIDPPVLQANSGLHIVVLSGLGVDWRQSTAFSYAANGPSVEASAWRVVGFNTAIWAVELGPGNGPIIVSDGLTSSVLQVKG